MSASTHANGSALELRADMKLLGSPNDTASARLEAPPQQVQPPNDTSTGSIKVTSDVTNCTVPRDDLLQDVAQWIRDLETVHRDMQMLSAQNAFLLDSMAMAGADFD